MGPTTVGKSARCQRRARFEVAVGLAAFVLVQGIVALLVEVWFPTYRDPLFAARAERFRKEQAEAPSRSVVFLGSSRTALGVRTALLSRRLEEALGRPVAVFNYGVIASGCESSAAQWRRLRAAGARPDLVVVEVVPALLDALYRLKGFEAAWPAGEMDWADIDQIVRFEPARRHLYLGNALARVMPLHGHRLVMASRLAPHRVPVKHLRPLNANGETPNRVPPHKYAAALKSVQWEFEPPLADFRLSPARVAVVKGLLADLREAGVAAALVVMPEGPEFRSWYRPGAWPLIEERLREACALTGAHFVSARDWFGEDSFSDSHHLTEAGARRYSARLGEEVLVPLLAATTDGGDDPG